LQVGAIVHSDMPSLGFELVVNLLHLSATLLGLRSTEFLGDCLHRHLRQVHGFVRSTSIVSLVMLGHMLSNDAGKVWDRFINRLLLVEVEHAGRELPVWRVLLGLESRVQNRNMVLESSGG